MGDALTLNNLEKYLDILYNDGLRAHITTAGFYLPSHRELLKTHPAIKQINFSLNGFNGAKIHMDIAKYLGVIFEFCIDLAKVGDRFVNLRLWNGNGNIDDVEFFNSVKEQINTFFDVDIGYESKRVRLANKIIFDFDNYFEWPDLCGQEQQGSYCLGLIDQFAILSDGTVVPCCLDYNGEIKLGNVFESSLDDILSTSRAINIVENFKKGIATEELCRKCSYRLRFLT